ncbi:RDD family protein [Streptomyces althioticus]|uniref:RDD family protein n=1 Tax=Streptomyces althioticus TaxID=83380 RepID=UPI003872AE35|nr:RDD family protein [Streptomyces althioticus]
MIEGPARIAPPETAASEGRRLAAVLVDGVFGLLAGLVVGVAASMSPGSPTPWVAGLGGALAASLVNHVLVTWATQRSLGKLAAGLRVVRDTDGGRPQLPALARRWIYGLGWMLFAAPLHVASDSDVQQQDACGLRVVRRRGHLVPSRKA